MPGAALGAVMISLGGGVRSTPSSTPPPAAARALGSTPPPALAAGAAAASDPAAVPAVADADAPDDFADFGAGMATSFGGCAQRPIPF